MLTDYTTILVLTEGINYVGINGIDLAGNISIDSTTYELAIAWAKLTENDSKGSWAIWP